MRTVPALCLVLSMLTYGCGDIVVSSSKDTSGGVDAGGAGDTGGGGGGGDAKSGCTSNADCDDGNACTTNACTVDGTCLATNVANDTSCDDGDGITFGDKCTDGVCAGTAIDCSALGEGKPCVDGVFDPATGACTTQNAADGTSCDDGDGGTVGDTCTAGVCAGTAIDCSALDDAAACKEGYFETTTGGCAVRDAADGTACPAACGDGTCASGACQTPSCDDGDPCTTDSCDESTGDCVHAAIPGCGGGGCQSAEDCADDDPCTEDTCEVDTGDCVNLTVPGCTACGDPADCEDGDDCTEDVCDGGVCQHVPIEPCGAGCTTNADCPAPDCEIGTCDAVNGVCVYTPDPDCGGCVSTADCPAPGNACLDVQCNGGVCVETLVDGCIPPCVDNAECDDNDPCTSDFCTEVAGMAELTCINLPVWGTPDCPDPAWCNGATDCDDGDPCTYDQCIDDGSGQAVCTNNVVPGCGGGPTCVSDADCSAGGPCADSYCGANGTCVVEPKFNEGDYAASVYGSYQEINLLALRGATYNGSSTGLDAVVHGYAAAAGEVQQAGSLNAGYQGVMVDGATQVAFTAPGGTLGTTAVASGSINEIQVELPPGGGQLVAVHTWGDVSGDGWSVQASSSMGSVFLVYSGSPNAWWYHEIRPENPAGTQGLALGPITSDGDSFAALVRVDGQATMIGADGNAWTLDGTSSDGSGSASWFLIGGDLQGGSTWYALPIVPGYAFQPIALALAPAMAGVNQEVYVVGSASGGFPFGPNWVPLPPGAPSSVLLHLTDGNPSGGLFLGDPSGNLDGGFVDVVATGQHVFVSGLGNAGAMPQSFDGGLEFQVDATASGRPVAWVFDRWLGVYEAVLASSGASGSLMAGGPLAVAADGEVGLLGMYFGDGDLELHAQGNSRSYSVGWPGDEQSPALFMVGLQPQADPWMAWAANVGGEGLQDITARALAAMPDGSWGIGGMFVPWGDGQGWFGPSSNNFGVVGTVTTDPSMSSQSSFVARVDGNSSLSCGAY